MANILFQNDPAQWPQWRVYGFKFITLFLGLFSFPLIDWNFYRVLFQTKWTSVYDFLSIASYTTHFGLDNGSGNGAWAWLILAVVALIGAIVWERLRPLRDKEQYQTIYYWASVLLRYKIGIALVAFGLIKFFPLQIPYPSLSNLHTNYGDYLPWKIYYHTIGITQGYESFLGFVEILVGVLLLIRSGVVFGAGIILGFTGNVLVANIAYNIGEQYFLTYVVIGASYLLAKDVPRIYTLLFERKFTKAEDFSPSFNISWLPKFRDYGRIAVILFLGVTSYKAYSNFTNDFYLYPKAKGITKVDGFYDVRLFVVGNDTIPYSRTNPKRWQNVVFEKWATLSIKTAEPIKIDTTKRFGYQANDLDRNYESAGVGDRRYYHYTTDTLTQTIALTNKNKNYASEQLTLNYKILGDSVIVLKGTNAQKEPVYAELKKINRKYMLFEGRRKPVKL